jgi:hypothetical protein
MPLSPVDSAATIEPIPHSYSGYYHCWPCRKQLIDSYFPAIKRRRLVSSAAKYRLFVKIHIALLDKAAEPNQRAKKVAVSLSRPAAAVPSYADAIAEKELWLAVVERALLDLSTKNRPGVLAAALDWVNSAKTEVGSLRWICNQMQIDAGAAREQILKSGARGYADSLTFVW